MYVKSPLVWHHQICCKVPHAGRQNSCITTRPPQLMDFGGLKHVRGYILRLANFVKMCKYQGGVSYIQGNRCENNAGTCI